MDRHASRAAAPLRSEPVEAAVAETFATRSVLVDARCTSDSGTPSVRAVTRRILPCTPWPISIAPVVTTTVPST